MKKKIIALVLCVCLISSSCIQPAYAVGAEGIIIGGGAAAGVTLTLPQVALIVAAGYGLVFAAQHAEEIADGLNTALTNAANKVADGLEVLSGWKDNALKGLISLSSAPSWIADAITGWVGDLYNTPSISPVACVQYNSGEFAPAVTFWDGSTDYMPVPCTVIRAGSVSITSDGGFYSFICKMLIISTMQMGGADYGFWNEGVRYYVDSKTWATNPQVGELSEYNQQAYDAIMQLPNLTEIKNAYPNVSLSEEAIFKAWCDGLIVSGDGSVCPDVTVGGIGNAVEEHGIDNVKLPDMNIGASGLLAPDVVGDGSIDDVLNDVITRLKEQELAWSDYMADVGVGNPSVSIPQEDGTTLDFPITDVGVGDVPIEPPSVPEGLEPYTIDLTDFFPFCIPFDIADFVSVLCAEAEAPCFEWEFTWYDGSKDSLTIDLSPFDQVAQLLRNMELLLFCIGLALITRNQIRG